MHAMKRFKRFRRPQGGVPITPLRHPGRISGIIPATKSAFRLAKDIQESWSVPHLNDEVALSGDGGGTFLDNLGGFLNKAAGAYRTYTGAQEYKDQADAARAAREALERQRAAAGMGTLYPTAGGMMSNSTFGVPNTVLMLAGGGLLAWYLLKRK